MATSSITANFYCDDAKAANTFVDLLFSDKTPDGWTAVKPSTALVHSFASEDERTAFLKRTVTAARRRHTIRCFV